MLKQTAFKVAENLQMFCTWLMSIEYSTSLYTSQSIQTLSIILPGLPEPNQSELVQVEVLPVHLPLDSACPQCSPHIAEVERGHPGEKPTLNHMRMNK